MEQTAIEQATAELNRQFSKTDANGGTVQHSTLADILQYLNSCGIEVPEDQRYHLVQHLRTAGYQESRMDNELHFHLYS